jgi:phage head maturation protease
MTELPELEYRTATQIGMSFPNRTIELVVMPYEEEAVVDYRGRAIREVVSRGAFDGIEQRPGRVKINRDHDVTRTCGHAVTFHPSSEEGLVAEVYVSKTILGDETLVLANDGDLDASAGFRPKFNKATNKLEEDWPSRDYRRLNKIWLGHIAMTPDPAYLGARTLAVRSQASTEAPGGIVKPNRAEWLALRRQDEYDLISR